MQIQSHEAQQLVVVHLGQQRFARLRPRPRRRPGSSRAIIASIRSSTVPRQTNLWTRTFLLLADAEGAVGGLVLDGRVPPAVEVDHVRGRRQVQAGAAGLEREHEERRAVLALELLDQLRAACRPRVPPCSTRPGRPKTPARNSASGSAISRNCVKTSTFSCRSAISSHSSRQPLELAAVARRRSRRRRATAAGWLQICLSRIRCASTSPRRSMPSAVFELLGQVVDRLLVQRRLLLAQPAVRRSPRSCPAGRR